jgi:phosphohistidine phosphatase
LQTKHVASLLWIWQNADVKIFVMRHGPAEDSSPSGSDAERDLTPAGRERVRNVAQALLAQNELPLVIVSSPLVRSLQTAEIVAGIAQQSGVAVTVSTRRELAPGGNGLALASELRLAQKRRVMLVGHEPDVAVLITSLGLAAAQRGFMKAMVMGVSIPDASTDLGTKLQARLRFVLDPKTLAFERASG